MENNIRYFIANRIRERRKDLELTQTELGKRLGVKRAAVCLVEKAYRDFTTDQILAYSKALDVSPAYLMGWSELDNIKEEQDLSLIEYVYNRLSTDGKAKLLQYAVELGKDLN